MNCPICQGDGWVAIPRWADAEKRKIQIYKIRCSCGTFTEESGIITMAQLNDLDGYINPAPAETPRVH